jgi:hypothetical protein
MREPATSHDVQDQPTILGAGLGDDGTARQEKPRKNAGLRPHYESHRLCQGGCLRQTFNIHETRQLCELRVFCHSGVPDLAIDANPPSGFVLIETTW